jgi:hypothetical protein
MKAKHAGGRPPVEVKLRNYSIALDDKTVEILNRLCGKMDLSRSMLMRNLVMYGLQDLVGLEKIGVVRAVAEFRRMKKNLTGSDLAELRGELS